jgi:hypothetical protein
MILDRGSNGGAAGDGVRHDAVRVIDEQLDSCARNGEPVGAVL